MSDEGNSGSNVPNGPGKNRLDAGEILVAEFEYIAQSAFQSNEDRARVSTYYVVTFGTLVAALFSLRVGSGELFRIHIALIVVFMTLAIFGISTLLQLVQLRLGWRACAIAMNTMKEYYIKELKDLKLGNALAWRMNTIPHAHKKYSVAYLLALQVALLGGVSMGASFYFIGVVLTPNDPSTWQPWVIGLLVGLLYSGILVEHYRVRLEKGEAKQDAEVIANKAEDGTDEDEKADEEKADEEKAE